MEDGFIKVGVCTPQLKVADCRGNGEKLAAYSREASEQGVQILCFPELSLTGYTCGDLFLQSTLMKGAEEGLSALLAETCDLDLVIGVGLPIQSLWSARRYNVAAILHRGTLLGLVPKTYLPNYGEFYERRWFASGEGVEEWHRLCGQQVRLSRKQIFSCTSMPALVLGVELCEDLWAPQPPSTELAQQGATVILNLSASNEVVGKGAYRRQLVTGQSGRLICGYLYANAGQGESTTDLVFSGHSMIAEHGGLVAEHQFTTGLLISELDLDRLTYERQRNTTFSARPPEEKAHCVEFALERRHVQLTRPISPTPFVPQRQEDCESCCQEVLQLATLGLCKRLEHTGAKTAVVGLSGGLDSTLALLITAEAMEKLGRSASQILGVTMPCFGTTSRTRKNARVLAQLLGATLQEIDIGQAVKVHFQDIGHPMEDHSVTFENGQARERTQVLMDLANQREGLVIGTGDLSELALGWATYGGDHISMYGVNGGIPKTLIGPLISCWAGKQRSDALKQVLQDILETPISPELLPPKEGEIAQRTEDLVGPYELHDFFLYYAIRWGCPPKKIFRLAQYAMGERYERDTLLHWLTSFYRRFFAQQFKRSCLPDGPKVGSLSLSPRGDWRMPSDGVAHLWLRDLEHLAGGH